MSIPSPLGLLDAFFEWFMKMWEANYVIYAVIILVAISIWVLFH